MANPEYLRSQTISRAPAAVIDEGLRAYMTKVYALMAGAMVITGLVSYIFGMDLKAAVAGQPTTLIPAGLLAAMFSSPLKWVVMLAPLGVVFAFSAMIHRMSAGTAQMVFWGFAALMGLSLSHIFVVFTGISIAQTFFATAAAFGALSIYGYTTKKDLSAMGAFLIMGAFGLLIASLINIFVASSALQVVISLVGVVIFAGLTAYDTQAIKNEYLTMRTSPDGQAFLEQGAVMGALRLYLDFINMFTFLLQFMGDRE